jgi:hypothetical protein
MNVEDHPVLAEEAIGQNRADHRKQVHPGHEQVGDLSRANLGIRKIPFGHRILRREPDEQTGEVDVEDLPHPVVRKPFGALVPYDVGDSRWKPIVAFRDRGCSGSVAHGRGDYSAAPH